MASRNRLPFIVCSLALALSTAVAVAAQEPAPSPASDQQQTTAQQQTEQQDAQQKAQAAREKQALKWLDQTVEEAQALRLPENRIRIQFIAADMLWKHDEARARSLFNEAQASLAAMINSATNNDRQQLGTAAQVRQELLTVAAQHDPSLALDILRATRLPQTAQQNNPYRRTDTEANMEFSLLALVAANDPKQALQKAEEMLNKGDYSPALLNLLTQLQSKDKDAAAKLMDDVLKGLHTENLTTNQNARNLAFSLLRSGPQPADQSVQQKVSATSSGQANVQTNGQVLGEAAYRDLLDTVVSAALSVTVQSTTLTVRGGGRGGIGFGPRGGFDQSEMNRRILLAQVMSLWPYIE